MLDRIFLLFLSIALLLGALAQTTESILAAEINLSAETTLLAVDCNDNPIILTSNSVSDLRDAIACANNTSEKTIDLGEFTFTLTNSPYSETGVSGDFGLPTITAASMTIINGTIERTSSYDCTSNNFRIFYTDSGSGLTLEEVTLRNGCLTNGSGGAIYLDGDVTLSKSTIENNEAANGGGAYIDNGSLTVVQSLFVSNSATNGGAVYSDGAFSAENSTFSDNTATTNGGALYQTNSEDASITHTTIANNTATTGGGVYLNQFFTSFTTLFANIIADNSGGDCFASGSVFASYNLISDLADEDVCFLTDTVDNNQIGDDPLLSALADHGGPTMTHRPAIDSPATDQISGNGCGSTYAIDQRGFDRPVNTTCDIGAVEVRDCTMAASNVSTVESLNKAIFCYNEATSGNFVINIEQSFTLAFTSTTIHNASNVPLLVNGSNHTIDGDNTYRHFNIESGNVTIDSIVLQNGSTTDDGGAIQLTNGVVLTISNSTLVDNSARNGGGIQNRGTLTILNSTIDNNEATGSGAHGWGGGISNRGMLTMQHSTISNNMAGGIGGGLYMGSPGTISNSTFSSNSSIDVGGGIFSGGQRWYLYNSTITENSSQAEGDGVMFVGSATFGNVILANNGSENCGGDPVTDWVGTNIQNGNSCFSISGPAPINSNSIDLQPLADNGCTEMQATSAGMACGLTHAVTIDSSAVDAGDSSICSAEPVNNLDNRGFSRPVGDACDIGAFEQQSVPSAVHIKAISANVNQPLHFTLNFLISLLAIVTGWLFIKSRTEKRIVFPKL